MSTQIKIALIGVGNVGQNFLRILEMKAATLQERYGLSFVVTGVADSSGIAINNTGFDPAIVRQFKQSGGRISQLDGFRPDLALSDALQASGCSLLLEASPVNLTDGGPGLAVTRAALGRGIHVVLANKGPLVLAHAELHELATSSGAGLAFSATVCGALPVINIGQRDLIAANIHLLRGIFNSTSNFILAEMEAGRSFDEALAEAQRRGIAEADPSLDVDGWDTANKLIIIANSVLNLNIGLDHVTVEGIRHITANTLQTELAAGNTIKLLASAIESESEFTFSVKPTVVALESFLGRCDGWEMGVEIQSDLYGRMYHKIWEREPLPTAAAMLRDAVNLVRR